MGYAEAAGLPAIAGLYATVGALVAYFLVGPSRILVFGPDSALLPLVAAAVVPLAGGDPARSIALAAALAIMAGVLCLGAAVARLGFVTDLLSRPIRVGYMNGIALTILVSQLPKLLGFSVDANDVVGGLVGLVRGIADGEVVPLALAIGLGEPGGDPRPASGSRAGSRASSSPSSRPALVVYVFELSVPAERRRRGAARPAGHRAPGASPGPTS